MLLADSLPFCVCKFCKAPFFMSKSRVRHELKDHDDYSFLKVKFFYEDNSTYEGECYRVITRFTIEEITLGIDETSLTVVVTGLLMLNSSFYLGIFVPAFYIAMCAFFSFGSQFLSFLIVSYVWLLRELQGKKKECCFICLLC